ncbi:MgtC/SapB family protein [Oceanithermus profundus]
MESSLTGLALATLVGFAVGLERERAKRERETGALGGVRTFALIGLLGGLVGVLGSGALALTGFLVVGALALWSLTRAPGATSEVAALVVYLLGMLAGEGQATAALFGGLVTLGLLTYRERLHRWSAQIGEETLEAAVLLALLWGVVWPLLPEGGYGPGGVLRPREVWLMVLLVAAANFAGFVLTRLWRERGLYAAALAGGLVSSTAVTVSMAARAREHPASWRTWAVAAGLATVLMYLRVLVWVALFAPALLEALAPALALWALVNLAACLLLARGAGGGGGFELKNPLGLGAALLFGGLYALIKLAAYAAGIWLGAAGVYAVAALSGLQDLDAITLSMARLFTQGGLEAGLAVRAILLATLVNNAVKATLGYLGHPRMGFALALALLPGALAAWAWMACCA